MLAEEFGTASNIKSRVNRQSVLGAITSTQQRLKLYNKVPPNGLVVYCGDIITSEGKERKINIDFEPFKPINTSLYLCDNKFHVEALSELLESDQKFGFIIMDGNGALFGTLSNVKFIQEKKLIGKYFDEISQDSGKVCYGVEDTLKSLELGAAETLIVYENLDITRWVLKASDGSEKVLHTTKQQEADREQFMDKETGQEMEVVEQGSFLEWLAEKYKDFGATLEFVSDRSSAGNQFVKGFGGIGAVLRYKVNFEQLVDVDDEDEFYDGMRKSLLSYRGTLC